MTWRMERMARFLFLSVGQLLTHVSSVVPPATNVTLECHNFQNTLRWDYSQHDSLKPQFKVHIQDMTRLKVQLVDYPHLQCDLSEYWNPDKEYRVLVKALVGLNESLPAPADGWTFSYFYGTPSTLQCTLDLPPVNITAELGAGLKFSFNHPSVVYRHKLPTEHKRRQRKQAKKLSAFNYNVVVANDQSTHHYTCVTDVCERSIPSDLQQDTSCVKVSGLWEKIAVKGTQVYCATSVLRPTTSHQALYIGLGLLALGLMTLFILIVTFCFKKVSGTPMPKALNIAGRGCDSIDTPLIHDLASLSPGSPVSPVLCSPHPPSKLPTEETCETDEKEQVVGLPVDWPPAGHESMLPAPRGEPAAGQGDPSAEPRAGDYLGRAAGGDGPGRPNEDVMGEGAQVAEPQNASGYEQRERLVTTVALINADEKIDAYHY